MKRDYDTGTAETIIFFTGIEVEKTPAFGMKDIVCYWCARLSTR